MRIHIDYSNLENSDDFESLRERLLREKRLNALNEIADAGDLIFTSLSPLELAVTHTQERLVEMYNVFKQDCPDAENDLALVASVGSYEDHDPALYAQLRAIRLLQENSKGNDFHRSVENIYNFLNDCHNSGHMAKTVLAISKLLMKLGHIDRTNTCCPNLHAGTSNLIAANASLMEALDRYLGALGHPSLPPTQSGHNLAATNSPLIAYFDNHQGASGQASSQKGYDRGALHEKCFAIRNAAVDLDKLLAAVQKMKADATSRRSHAQPTPTMDEFSKILVTTLAYCWAGFMERHASEAERMEDNAVHDFDEWQAEPKTPEEDAFLQLIRIAITEQQNNCRGLSVRAGTIGRLHDKATLVAGLDQVLLYFARFYRDDIMKDGKIFKEHMENLVDLTLVYQRGLMPKPQQTQLGTNVNPPLPPQL